jgi:hypothetical protein
MTNTLSTSISTGITLTPTGTYQSPFTITSAGLVAPSAFGGIGVYGSAASGLTLINQGVIKGGGGIGGSSITSGGAGGIGVELLGVSSFTNSGTISGGSGGSGYSGSGGNSGGGYGAVGVELSGTGSFSNSGTISGGNGGGYAGLTGGAGGTGIEFSGGGSISNSGIIVGGSGGFGGTGGGNGGTGADLLDASSFSNSSTITGGIGGSGGTGGGNGGVGLELAGSGSFSNGGTISGGSGSTSSGNGGTGGTGVELLGAGSFTNSAAISGGNGGGNANSGTGGTGGTGVELSSDGSISNSSTITGGFGGSGFNGGVGGAGIFLSGGGTFNNSGTIDGGNGASGFFGYGAGGTGAYLSGGTLLNSGLIAGAQGADAVQFGTNASTLIVESGATFTGNVVANATISDVLAIGGSAPVTLSNIGAEYQNFRILAFETGSSGIVSGTYTAMDNQSITNIAGFAQGDTLILNGFAATSDTYVSGTGLELGNGTSEITLDITGNFSTTNFNVIDPPANTTISLNSNPPCFAQGTRILTTRGEIPVEQLRANDHAILHSGGTAPIQWIGHRSLAPARHPNPAQVNPIRIAANALMDGIPRRDLVLSPDHALYLNGALIPAKSLLNGSTIRQEPRRTITYFHIELPHHAVLYAEGTPAESYLETGNRNAFANGGGALTLHPDFAQTLREQTGCAPFAESGPIVEQTRAQILARTHQPLTNDPALTLQPNPDGSVTIHSRRAIPGYFSPDPRDQRTLGVKILSLHAGSRKIPLDHPLLTEGWHGVEPDGRWTNGSGLIPAALAKHGPITIKLAATLAYPTQQPTQHRTRQRA